MRHVDVAVPTHGEPRFLADTIASVLAQTHEAFTLTVLDNSAGGGAAAGVVDGFRHDRRVRSVATGGVSLGRNWNRCIGEGSAPYVGVLSHDELWDPGFLARRVAALDAHPECGFAFSAPRVIDEAGALTAERAHRLRPGVHSPREALALLAESNPVGPSTILVRRAAYEALDGGFVEDADPIMDWIRWSRLAARFPIVYLPVRDNAAGCTPTA